MLVRLPALKFRMDNRSWMTVRHQTSRQLRPSLLTTENEECASELSKPCCQCWTQTETRGQKFQTLQTFHSLLRALRNNHLIWSIAVITSDSPEVRMAIYTFPFMFNHDWIAHIENQRRPHEGSHDTVPCSENTPKIIPYSNENSFLQSTRSAAIL